MVYFALSYRYQHRVNRIPYLFNNNIYCILNFCRCSDEHKRTPLHFAAAKGYTEIVDILLRHGADPNQKVIVSLIAGKT
jgi:ankyrin repeat protein